MPERVAVVGATDREGSVGRQSTTAALEAPGVECLALTGGLRPSNAVLGRATQAGVPVLLVRSDTRVTVDRLEDVFATGRTHDPETVAWVELLWDHVDALLDA